MGVLFYEFYSIIVRVSAVVLDWQTGQKNYEVLQCAISLPLLCYFHPLHQHIFLSTLFANMGRDRSVAIATRYGQDGLGIEFRWVARFSARVQTGRDPPNLLYNGYRVFPGGKAAVEWQ